MGQYYAKSVGKSEQYALCNFTYHHYDNSEVEPHCVSPHSRKTNSTMYKFMNFINVMTWDTLAGYKLLGATYKKELFQVMQV